MAVVVALVSVASVAVASLAVISSDNKAFPSLRLRLRLRSTWTSTSTGVWQLDVLLDNIIAVYDIAMSETRKISVKYVYLFSAEQQSFQSKSWRREKVRRA